MKMDDINIAIIKQMRDGRKSYKEIADRLYDLNNQMNTIE